MPRRRPRTELYLAAVEEAIGQPGRWIELGRDFDTEFNAAITGSCLGGGYLRVQPRDGDVPVTIGGKRYIRTGRAGRDARSASRRQVAA